VVFAHETGATRSSSFDEASVRISLPIDGKHLHVASFGRGDFIGEIAFLDHGARSADAIAESEVSLYVVSRAAFDRVAQAHPSTRSGGVASLASALALRLRTADARSPPLEEG
jgi:SulP family sulfate permease